MHLSEVLSVPIGHPARLGEQVRPALLPAASLPPPHFCAPEPHLGGVWVGAFESSWSCSPAFLPSPTEGKLRPSMQTMELGSGPSMRKDFTGHEEAIARGPPPFLLPPSLGTNSSHPRILCWAPHTAHEWMVPFLSVWSAMLVCELGNSVTLVLRHAPASFLDLPPVPLLSASTWLSRGHLNRLLHYCYISWPIVHTPVSYKWLSAAGSQLSPSPAVCSGAGCLASPSHGLLKCVRKERGHASRPKTLGHTGLGVPVW